MDIQKNGNTIHIQASNNSNDITVERKGHNTEVTIDGEKEVFKGKENIIIDAGGGNDHIKVTNLASGKSGAPQVTIIGGDGDDYIEAVGNVKVIDNKGINTVTIDTKDIQKTTNDAFLNGYIAEIETIQSRKNPALELKDKEEILGILKRVNEKGYLPDLAAKMDKENTLLPLYRDMGTLINQGEVGSSISATFMILTGFKSLGVEAENNRAYIMKDLLKNSNVPESILKKLK